MEVTVTAKTKKRKAYNVKKVHEPCQSSLIGYCIERMDLWRYV